MKADAFMPLFSFVLRSFGLALMRLFGCGCWGLGEGGDDFVQVVLGVIDADHGGEAFAVMVVDVYGADPAFGLDEEVDGVGAFLSGYDGIVQRVGADGVIGVVIF